MTIAAKLKKFLNAHRVGYRVLSHTKMSNWEGAFEELRLPHHQFAYSVGLLDEKGLLIAVLPSDAQLNLPLLNKKLRHHFKIVTSLILDKLYVDCEPGEHPPIAEPYGVNMIIDTALTIPTQIYFSSGAHSSLLGIHREDFRYVTANQKWCEIATPKEKLVSM